MYGSTDSQLTALDIWGANAYRGKSFYSLFDDYQKKLKKPLWIAEFGIDAWHANRMNDPGNGYEDQETQSRWDGNLWDEIVRHVPMTIGGVVMEYSDEWWKAAKKNCPKIDFNKEKNARNIEMCCSHHNHSGHKDYGFPGKYTSEEWFGIMSIARNTKDPHGPDQLKERKVYFNLQKKWQINPYNN